MMDFSFTEEQEMLRKTVRHFVDKESMPFIKSGMNDNILNLRF